MPVAGCSVSQEAESALFDDGPAHVAGVDGHIPPTAGLRFLDARGEERRVQTAIAQRGQGGATPQAGEGARWGEADPAARGRGIFGVGEVDGQVLWRVSQLIGESVERGGEWK